MKDNRYPWMPLFHRRDDPLVGEMRQLLEDAELGALDIADAVRELSHVIQTLLLREAEGKDAC